MRVGNVIGAIWATRKDLRLRGYKLLVVQPVHLGDDTIDGAPVVAVDIIGAGAGERVLLSSGSAARHAVGGANAPVDMAVVAIIDDQELDKNGDRR